MNSRHSKAPYVCYGAMMVFFALWILFPPFRAKDGLPRVSVLIGPALGLIVEAFFLLRYRRQRPGRKLIIRRITTILIFFVFAGTAWGQNGPSEFQSGPVPPSGSNPYHGIVLGEPSGAGHVEATVTSNPYVTGPCYDIAAPGGIGRWALCVPAKHKLYSFDGRNYFAMDDAGNVQQMISLDWHSKDWHDGEKAGAVKEFRFGVK